MAYLLIILILVAISIGLIVVYNLLNKPYHAIEAAKAGIKNIMQKQLLLIKQLTEIANKYVLHEKDVFLTISNNEKMKDALFYINTSADHFPKLKSNETYSKLMTDYMSIATEVQYKIDRHNDLVQEFNTKRFEWFSRLCVSLMGGFKRQEYLELTKFTYEDPLTVTIKEI